jgi:hypothetical protein
LSSPPSHAATLLDPFGYRGTPASREDLRAGCWLCRQWHRFIRKLDTGTSNSTSRLWAPDCLNPTTLWTDVMDSSVLTSSMSCFCSQVSERLANRAATKNEAGFEDLDHATSKLKPRVVKINYDDDRCRVALLRLVLMIESEGWKDKLGRRWKCSREYGHSHTLSSTVRLHLPHSASERYNC